MIKGLGHVCFGVADLERSVAFYRDKLGFKCAYDFVDANGRQIGQCLHIGGRSFIELFRSSLPAPAEQGHRHVCFEVDDIEAAAAELKRRGVEVTKINRGSDRSYNVWLADPDGNRLELQQYTAESKQGAWIG